MQSAKFSNQGTEKGGDFIHLEDQIEKMQHKAQINYVFD